MSVDAVSPARSLRDRPPACSVIAECLNRQQQARPLGRLARFFGRNPLHPDARAWYAGATGELHVAQQLSRLGPEWTVLHSVPVGSGDSDIDHVVVGPGGVFTINTKHHAGARVWVGDKRMLVNGHPVDHLRNSAHEAARAAKLLGRALDPAAPRPVAVRGVVALVGVTDLRIVGSARGSLVVTDRSLVRRLSRAPQVLGGAELAEVALAAARPGTWHTRGDAALVDGDPIRFAALRRQVDLAMRVRRLWMLGLVGSALVAGVGVVGSQLTAML